MSGLTYEFTSRVAYLLILVWLSRVKKQKKIFIGMNI